MTKARLRWDKEGKEYRSVHAELLVGDGIYARMNPCYCKLKTAILQTEKLATEAIVYTQLKNLAAFFMNWPGQKYVLNFQPELNLSYN